MEVRESERKCLGRAPKYKTIYAHIGRFFFCGVNHVLARTKKGLTALAVSS